MLTIEKCKQLLEDSENTYTDEEVQQIRDLLSLLSEIAMENYYHEDNENEKSSLDEQGKLGRTG